MAGSTRRTRGDSLPVRRAAAWCVACAALLVAALVEPAPARAPDAPSPWVSLPHVPSQAGSEPAPPERQPQACIQAGRPDLPSSQVFLAAGGSAADLLAPGAISRRRAGDGILPARCTRTRTAVSPRGPPAPRMVRPSSSASVSSPAWRIVSHGKEKEEA